MAKGIHKGTEYTNVNETWDNNERNRESRGDAGSVAPVGKDLEGTIRKEAAEYDEEKSDRILGGDRATVNDDQPAPPSEG